MNPKFPLLLTAFVLASLLACRTSPRIAAVMPPAYSTVNPDLRVFTEHASPELHAFLLEAVQQGFEERAAAIEEAGSSSEAAQARQQRMKAWFEPQLTSSFPEKKCVLNARTTGQVDLSASGFRVENILFQSRPNHHVTGNLYLPTERKGPLPAVLMTCGHSDNGKAIAVYQSMCMLLAQNGIICLITDPISQGERYQFLDESGQPATAGGTLTHSLLDYAANLTGTDVVSFEAWDNVRAIDYLISRPEVDSTRIGITGNSGGGTQTAFLMGYDSRIKVAVPSCYLTSYEGLIGGIGPQDGCQQLYGEGAVGFDHGDFVNMAAPLPIRMLAAEQDYFPIAYVRRTFSEVQRIYRALGAEEKVGLFTYDDKHGYSRPRRQAGVTWFRRWFLGDTTAVVEGELPVLPDDSLLVCATGQVLSTLPGERSVVELLLERADQLTDKREAFQAAASPQQVREKVAALLNLPQAPQGLMMDRGEWQTHTGFRLQPCVIRAEGEFPLAALYYEPATVRKSPAAHLVIDGLGKAHAAQQGGKVLELLREGQPVLAIDLRGLGESKDDPEKNTYIGGTQDDYRNGMIAWYLARPMLGQRVQDIRMATDALALLTQNPAIDVQVYASGRGALAALHAGVFDSRLRTLQLADCPRSWREIIQDPLKKNLLTQIVPDALSWYDLDDLARLMVPREVQWIGEFVGEGL